jgi:hypothetical protein
MSVSTCNGTKGRQTAETAPQGRYAAAEGPVKPERSANPRGVSRFAFHVDRVSIHTYAAVGDLTGESQVSFVTAIFRYRIRHGP